MESLFIKDTEEYLERAEKYLNEKDYKASAVYIRSEFERLIKTICEKKKLLVIYKLKPKDFDTNDFWEAIRMQTDIDPSLVKEIEMYRGVVMNPLSHYDLEKPEFEKELADTISAVQKLKDIKLNNLKSTSFMDLVRKIESLNSDIAKKEETIAQMSNTLNSRAMPDS